MNIFYLHKDPDICATYHCDKHVLKMIIEYAQLLSTAHRLLDGVEGRGSSKSGKTQVRVWTLDHKRDNLIYKASHVNHPSNIWVRSSSEHYIYTMELWNYLCKEYTNRYGKVHMTFKKLCQYINQLPKNIDYNVGFLELPQCMPDDCKRDDAITAYRGFYRAHKREFATWKNQTPHWFN
jgi:hypothetical protein